MGEWVLKASGLRRRYDNVGVLDASIRIQSLGDTKPQLLFSISTDGAKLQDRRVLHSRAVKVV